MTRDGITSVRIERFRGVAGDLVLDFDADAVLIEGANGTGKSTIADAIAWCLTGALPALTERQKGELAKHDPVVSAYRRGEQARVSLTLSLDGRPVTIIRTGSGDSSRHHVEHASALGRGAERLVAMLENGRLADWLYSVTLLRQDLVARFATASADVRYQQMRALLGLSYLDRFEAAARSTSKRYLTEATAAEQAAAEAMARLDERTRRVGEALALMAPGDNRAAADRLHKLTKAAQPLIHVQPLPRISRDEVAQLGTEVSALVEATQVVLRHAPDSGDRISDLRSQLTTAEIRLREEYEEHRRAAAGAPWQQLASAALELVGDSCPVCEQPVNNSAIQQRLRRILEETAAATSDLETVGRRIEALRTDLSRLEASLGRAQTAAAERERSITAWRAIVARLSLIRVPDTSSEPTDFPGVATAAEVLRDGLRQLYIDVSSPPNSHDLARLEEELTAARVAAAQARDDARSMRERAERARQLERGAIQAGVSLTRDALTNLDPAFDALYERLAPHPTFRELELVHEVKYRKGRTSAIVRDPLADVAINPAVAFSEGQHNALAVTMFAALALSVPQPPLPFLFLDDPLQTLDGPNVLGFAELCRELRDRRQLIVTTHDRRFSSLLARKLGPRETGRDALLIRFEGWRPEGPTVTTSRIAGEPVPRVLAAA